MRFLQLKFLLPLIAVVVLLLAALFIMSPRFCASKIVFENPDGSIDVVARLWGSDHPCAWAYFGPREITVKVPGVDQSPGQGQSPAELGVETLDSLQAKIGFDIKLPSQANVPSGFVLRGAFESVPFEQIEGKNGPYTINGITLIYWDKDLRPDVREQDMRDDGALFIEIVHTPGSTVDDFGPPSPPRAIGDVPEPISPPSIQLKTLDGNPAIIEPGVIEVFVVDEETVYRIFAPNTSEDVLVGLIRSIIRG